jgi:putative component of membrane protein insertase Oxa1/YidC/SpoIIIJ protein YidD
MAFDVIDTLTRRLAVRLINRYRLTVSQRKQFACAHRILYGGDSCSQFGLALFQEVRWYTAVRRLAIRLQACSVAARVLEFRAYQCKRERKNTGFRCAEGGSREQSQHGEDPSARINLPVVESSARCCLMSLISWSAVAPDGPAIGCGNSIFRVVSDKPLVHTARKPIAKSKRAASESEEDSS